MSKPKRRVCSVGWKLTHVHRIESATFSRRANARNEEMKKKKKSWNKCETAAGVPRSVSSVLRPPRRCFRAFLCVCLVRPSLLLANDDVSSAKKKKKKVLLFVASTIGHFSKVEQLLGFLHTGVAERKEGRDKENLCCR
ncbi:hypothetical protein DAPPUDRAFT_238528 [Daphnia pulex]|uniref:Uncharacterized protein n=1 Tax=Daphnia pulex TaxID=6669 RepID=E9G6M3_DAPPU|nr:hypothetical protein DAPPUDRAFT_238528 [Daphnia pulex]|eukprot:EFX84960.1 hypothetical protein DAPPUDRAFT_238528 [Daphnia pulex]